MNDLNLPGMAEALDQDAAKLRAMGQDPMEQSLSKGRPMTPTRLRECLEALHWTQRGLARILGRSEGTVRQWARGAVRIPSDVVIWLDALTAAHLVNPPPRRD